MRNIKSVRTKILAGFLAVSLITLVLGVFGITRMSAIADKAETMYVDTAVPIGQLGMMGFEFGRLRTHVLNHGLSDNDRRKDR